MPDDFLEDVNNGEAVNADRDRMSIGVQKLYLEMLVRGYGLQSFRDDVEELMIKTGVKGERVAFLFTDTSTSRGCSVFSANRVVMQCVPRLAAAISEQSCFSIELVRGYGCASTSHITLLRIRQSGVRI